MTAGRLVAVLGAGLALGSPGCGAAGHPGNKPDLTVSAASSLTKAFTEYGGHFAPAHPRFSFGGSDQLAAQISHGAKPDVFASANTALADMLYAKHLVTKPVVFTSNRLVIAVPGASATVRELADLAKPGVTIAVGSPTVPVGAYTRTVLSRLPPAEQEGILANVRSNEPEVSGVIAKVSERAVDAGFVYLTDVRAALGRAQAVELPDGLRPRVGYAVAAVRGTKHPAQAQAFIDGLLHGAGRQALLDAGFLSPPSAR